MQYSVISNPGASKRSAFRVHGKRYFLIFGGNKDSGIKLYLEPVRSKHWKENLKKEVWAVIVTNGRPSDFKGKVKIP